MNESLQEKVQKRQTKRTKYQQRRQERRQSLKRQKPQFDRRKGERRRRSYIKVKTLKKKNKFPGRKKEANKQLSRKEVKQATTESLAVRMLLT